jgi:hypothetical protein
MAQTEVKDSLSKNNVGWRWLIYVRVSQISSSMARGGFQDGDGTPSMKLQSSSRSLQAESATRS